MREPELTANSRRIFDMRYSRKDDDGNPTESPAESIDRVVMNVASVTAVYEPMQDSEGKGLSPRREWSAPQFPAKTAMRQYRYLGSGTPFEEMGWGHAETQADRYREMLTNLDFVPNSPTWTGAGTTLGQLAACFVLPIDDDLGRERSSIYETLKVAALIQQTGGGNGFSFSRLRPSGALVKTSMGKATGPVGFLKSYDATFGIIAQGGTRRGANMGVLRVDHPDIRSFIEAKVEEGEISNFNISVAVTDTFMDAVEKDEEFDLVHKDVIYTTINARELYDYIVSKAWIIGDPGTLFIDRANNQNPLPARYELEATNPCGEQWLGPYENCCLGSINFLNFITTSFNEGEQKTYIFDWDRFEDTIHGATQFLDDVIDANQYVPAVPELEEAAQGARRIGLGGMGLADAMAKLGIGYGTPEGQEFASQVTEFLRFHTMKASIIRAAERGPFEWIDDSIYDPTLLPEYGPGAEVEVGDDGKVIRLWSPPTSLVEHTINFGRPHLDWQDVVDGITQYGIRNAAQLTFAPTGTISNFASLQGSGCEPFFALVYSRNVMQEGENITLQYLNPIFEQALIDEGYTEREREVIMEQVQDNGGSCQGIEMLPDHIQRAFVVAADVTPEDHVRMQAAIQAFVDNSISKTINMPFEATVEDVSDVYRLAYELGCKGITIYRQGSRQLEVLSTGKKKADVDLGTVVWEPEEEEAWPFVVPQSMPASAEVDGLPARTIKVRTPHGAMWATVTEHPEYQGRPFDVRLTVGKAGNDKLADIEALGRVASLALRSGVPVGHLVEQLEGIGGASVVGFGPSRVKSAADGLSRALRRTYLEEHESEQVQVRAGSPLPVADPTRICPDCHNASLVMDQGCYHCEVRLGGCGVYEGCD